MMPMPVRDFRVPFFPENFRHFRSADRFIDHSFHSAPRGLEERGVERLFIERKSRAEEFINVGLNGAASLVQRTGGQWDFRGASPNVSDLRLLSLHSRFGKTNSIY